MDVFYSDTFPLPLPAKHRFPIRKYRRLRERLEQCDWNHRLHLQEAMAATDDQLLQVHSRRYLDQIKSGNLTAVEQRRIGFPWSSQLLERSRRSTGATVQAAFAAREKGAGVHLAGGTHHAFADHGQGFCVFNDVAVAIRALQREGLLQRAVVIDLDVHQGNGTASIFADDPTVFTFSMHGAGNFPFAKCSSDLDEALPDGTGDREYLDSLKESLDRLPFDEAEMIFYLAGADPYERDRYGKLKLSKEGLAERDRVVFAACRHYQRPVTVVMAGGYAENVEDIVDINEATIRTLFNEQVGPTGLSPETPCPVRTGKNRPRRVRR